MLKMYYIKRLSIYMRKLLIITTVIFALIFNTTSYYEENKSIIGEKKITEKKDNYGVIEIKKINLKTKFIDNNNLNKNVIVIKP